MGFQVTAIVVVRNGERELAHTLDALAQQTRRPDVTLVIDVASRDSSRAIAEAARPSQIVTSNEKLSFGEAIGSAVRLIAPPKGPDDVLWLLPHDAAPEPGALEALLAEMEVSPSVVAVGPKLVRWDNPDYIVEFGESLTKYGATVALVHDELDQGQHDGLSDVLAVSPAGMLVRHSVWTQLDGFDPALPVVDDALDFCVRARLAGHRISVAPRARVQFGGGGIAGASESDKWRLKRRRARQARTAQLHRRLAYAPAAAVFVHWLSLLPIATARSFAHLVMKTPGLISGEFRAALAVMFSGGQVPRSRSRVKHSQTSTWAALEGLRVSPDEMRRRRAVERETRIARVKGVRHELRFFASGGGWVLLVSSAISLLVFSRLLGATALVGGGLGLLNDNLGTLWLNAAYGWRDVSVGFVGAADPFMIVLAILGSLTPWSPSFAVVLLWLAAIPLAAMSAWFASVRFTSRGGIRALAAGLWALAPMFLAALGDGRPGAVIAHILLPLLALALVGASRSWASAATASLLFAAVAASAPSLIPALLIGWIAVVVSAGRGIAKVVSIPLPALVLFAPLAVTQFVRGTPLGLLADPGFPVAGQSTTLPQLVVGFPVATGWADALNLWGLGDVNPILFALILVAPLAAVALLGLYVPGNRLALAALVLAAAGLISALAAQQIQVATTGSEQVGLWTGSALSIYWLGLIGAAVVGLRSLGGRGQLVTGITTVSAIALVVPLLTAMVLGAVALRPAPARELPAFVAAEADATPRLATLEITPQSTGGLKVELQHGLGVTLDTQSTLAQTSRDVSPSQEQLAELAGNLVSSSGADQTQKLSELGVQFVLLSPPASDSAAAAIALDRASAALSEKSALVRIGDTDYGQLWRADRDNPPAAIPAGAAGTYGLVVLLVQVLVLGSTLLLALPTGVGREAPPKRVQRRPSTKSERNIELAQQVESGQQVVSESNREITTDSDPELHSTPDPASETGEAVRDGS